MIPRFAILAVALLAACDSARYANDVVPFEADEAAAPLAAPGGATKGETALGAATVNLDDEGVRLVDPATGSARALPFGTPMATVIAALEASFGAAPVEQEVNPECGAGPVLHARWANGFVALAQEDRFLGWDSRERGLTTADGIGIGSTRAELEASREVQVEESTLGVEFSAGGLGGLFASAEPQARITSIWAGLTCVFR